MSLLWTKDKRKRVEPKPQQRLASGLAAAIVLSGVLGFSAAYAETPADTLIVASQIDAIVSLDPAEAFEEAGFEVINNAYDTLVEVDPSNLGPVVPGLAESWTFSQAGKLLTFKIRPNTHFSSGDVVTAQDAAFSLQRVVRLGKTPVFLFSQFGWTAENVEQKIIAVDDNTLTLEFDKAYAPKFVLSVLTAPLGSVVDMDVALQHEQDGDLGNAWLHSNTAGSGGYSLVRWQPNEYYELAANADFWRTKPAIDKVVVRHVLEPATQRLLLERGDVDIARNLSPADIEAVSGNPDIRVDTDVKGQIWYIGLNLKNEFLSKPGVTQALKYLVDYDGMLNSFLKGQFESHQSFVPKSVPGSIDRKPYAFNVGKAKELLASAGVPDGFKMTMHLSNQPIRMEMAQSIQNTFAQAGVELELVVGSGAQVLAPYRARNHDAYLGYWTTSYPDPQATAGTFAINPDNEDPANAGMVAWRNAWDIPELTGMTVAALTEQDEDARAKAYEEIQEIHQDTSPFIILFQSSIQTAMRANVQGFVTGGAVSSEFFWTASK